MPSYDFVIAGGGLAGLSLACHLVRSPLCGASILIVDHSPVSSSRLWSYWTDQPTVFDPIVEHAWSQLHCASPTDARTLDLPGCRYELIRGADLHRFARRELALHANINFWQGTVEHVEDQRHGLRVSVDGQSVKAGWLFDSTSWIRRDVRSTNSLSMYFQGWIIESPRPAFNPQAVTFLDTRTPQQGDLRFFYVLPFSEHTALVEYVVYSGRPTSLAEVHTALHTYLQATLGLTGYTRVGEETGWLPICSLSQPRRLGRHHLAIGAKAGLVKPSTGFGFRRIQQDSAAIVRSLLQTGQPWRVRGVSRRHRWYDALLLDVLAQQGDELQPIFAALFTHNPLQRVLRFLDETTTLAEDLALISTLPARPFLQAVLRCAVSGTGFRPSQRRR